VRLEDERYEVKDLDKAIYRYKRAITILNEEGDGHAAMGLGYDVFNSIDYIEGALYDAMGKKIRSMKKSDLQDHSSSGDGSLASDDRYKYHNFYHRVYPYTVEYEFQVIKKETMFFPSWYPQASPFYAVQESRFTLITPSNYKPRYKAFNYAASPEMTAQGDKITTVWTVKNLPAERKSYGFPGWRHVSPTVIFGPSDFQVDKYKGQMNTWEDLAKFHLQLNEGRDVLPDNIKQQVQSIVSGKQSVREKVEALYDFLQKNTRYISVQFGVGGWQPFEAAYVAKNRYGDCKALSNYMYSLLKEAGIPSCYATIKAGDGVEDIVTDFPSSQFNHVILCVPMEKDSIWLECTSQTSPAGYMGAFTGNRHALLSSGGSGKLVRTPVYGEKENWQHTRVKAVIDETGNMSMEQSAAYSGVLQDDYADMINYLSKDKLKEHLNEGIDLPTYDIVEFNYKLDKKTVPVVYEQLKLSVSNYGQITGRRLFVTPNITNRSALKLQQEARKYPIRLINASTEADTIEITIPAGYTPEAMPENVVAETKFGKYQATYKVEANKIIYYRKLENYNGFFDKSLYDDLVKFYDKIYKSDRSRIVFVKS
jgi:transglutaminase-like putative cysteine protease